MTTTTGTHATSNSAAVYAQLNGSTTGKTATEASADRFLTLLVAQMKNQDPLSPMDNAQVTSQMAQINTVSGIEKVNESIQSMSSQFTQLQAMQGAQLVGQGVLVNGNKLAIGSDGSARASFDLAGAADATKVEVLSASGRVVGTVDLGAETTGRHSFSWTPPAPAEGQTPIDTGNLTFRVVATSGATQVSATPLMRDEIVAVSTSGGSLSLDLASGGRMAYADVKAFAE
ncbi:flagellar hook assembly protein FlgD [Leptothrix discophora]|uniref:Basal-body rod modification protein FlgD n=1 Tax=Leptothrix discophora TaxID=89 RepID=A0ABT9FY17_LEPDI|nr:flagellar hook assembly protein FlgD [Leptothrix discophora]MDP4299137.1 flagellar hook assembly protein FlgD [Leptothrix discophora]